jgi:phage terminase large subunit
MAPSSTWALSANCWPVATTEAASLRNVLQDPVQYSHRILGHRTWSKQQDILRAVATHSRTAVKACHSSGKTFTAADAALWWFTNFSDGIVITTAPTWTQVEKLLWGNIHNAIKGSKIKYPEPTKTELKNGPDNYILGISTNEGVRFQGWHGTILVILDEAPGVLGEIYDAIEGIRAGGRVHVVLLGNPIIPAGPFYDAFTINRRFWECITISAFDTPNFDGVCLDNSHLEANEDAQVFYGTKGGVNLLTMTSSQLKENSHPFLTTREWVYEKFFEWGPQHPLWESKVLGAFPSSADDALISLMMAERAKDTIPFTTTDPWFEAGIDVAGPGEDETSLTIINRPNIVRQRAWASSDPRGPVVNELGMYRGRLKAVRVDSVGQGYYFGKHLESQGFPVQYVNVGERPMRQPSAQQKLKGALEFVDLKSDLYWHLREQFVLEQVGGLTDALTVSQLTAIKYDYTDKGKIYILSKAKHRELFGMKSPDRAEGVMLAYAPDIRPRIAPVLQPSVSMVTHG